MTALRSLTLTPTTLHDAETTDVLARLSRAAGTLSLGMRWASEHGTKANGLADLAALLHSVTADIEAAHDLVDRASLRS